MRYFSISSMVLKSGGIGAEVEFRPSCSALRLAGGFGLRLGLEIALELELIPELVLVPDLVLVLV
jgi:hypothetical protein